MRKIASILLGLASSFAFAGPMQVRELTTEHLLNSATIVHVGTTTGTIVVSSNGNGSTGQVLTSTGPGSAPTFQTPITPVTNNYFNGSLNNTSTWTVTNAGFTSFTANGSTTLNTRWSNGLTVTAAASNGAGITFTPTTGAAYLITAKFGWSTTTSTDTCAFRLYDGSNAIGLDQTGEPTGGSFMPGSVTGVYVPGGTTAVTVSLQAFNVSNHTITIWASNNVVGFTGIEWNVVQIK